MQFFAHAHQHRSRLGQRAILTIHTPVRGEAGCASLALKRPSTPLQVPAGGRARHAKARAVPTPLPGFAASAAPPTHLPTHPASAAAHPAHRTCLPYDENPTRA